MKQTILGALLFTHEIEKNTKSIIRRNVFQNHDFLSNVKILQRPHNPHLSVLAKDKILRTTQYEQKRNKYFLASFFFSLSFSWLSKKKHLRPKAHSVFKGKTREHKVFRKKSSILSGSYISTFFPSLCKRTYFIFYC